MPTKNPRIHFIGIGGSGMLPLAHIALARGYGVSGSELEIKEDLTHLRSLGAQVHKGHDPSHIPPETEIVVYSSAIQDHNPEYDEARRRQIRIYHRSDLLRHFMEGKMAITVAGSHGKTTTTGLIGHMLSVLGHNPCIYIGGKMLADERPLGNGDIFLAEADESDGSFLKYTPYLNVITSMGKDHLDYYGSYDNLKAAFHNYCQKTTPDGCVILNWDQKDLRPLLHGVSCDTLSYGSTTGCDIRLLSTRQSENHVAYEVVVERDKVSATIPMIGQHNVSNTLAALAVARALDLRIHDAAKAIESFPGIRRRLELIYQSPQTVIYDDYAHNPDKIAMTLEALRASWPTAALHVIFQPHRYSRMETLYNEMVSAFRLSDIVYTLPIYCAGEKENPRLKTDDIARSIHAHSGCKSFACHEFDKAKELILANLTGHNVVVSVGAGDGNKVCYALKGHLEKTERPSQ